MPVGRYIFYLPNYLMSTKFAFIINLVVILNSYIQSRLRITITYVINVYIPIQ